MCGTLNTFLCWCSSRRIWSSLMRAMVAFGTNVFLFLWFLKAPHTDVVRLSAGRKQHSLLIVTFTRMPALRCSQGPCHGAGVSERATNRLTVGSPPPQPCLSQSSWLWRDRARSCGWEAPPTLWLGSWRRRDSLAPFPGCCSSTRWVLILPRCSQAGRAWPWCTPGSPRASVNFWSWNPTCCIDLDGSGGSPPCVISAKFPIFMWEQSYYLFSIGSCRPPGWQVCPLV